MSPHAYDRDMLGRFLRGSRRLPPVASAPTAASVFPSRAKWSAATYKPPPPPPPPPKADEKLVVLYPRQGQHTTSIEVKRRVLRSTPHMGAKRLKNMVRAHARKGNRNSFIADFESRLDRFLYRCNAVNSIFSARMLCGHEHVMVNGWVVNSSHWRLNPGDIVEPNRRKPGSVEVWKQKALRRLANNTFVLSKGDGDGRSRGGPRSREAPGITADFDALLRDGAAVHGSYRRLPPPKDAGASFDDADNGDAAAAGAAASPSPWPAARQAQRLPQGRNR